MKVLMIDHPASQNRCRWKEAFESVAGECQILPTKTHAGPTMEESSQFRRIVQNENIDYIAFGMGCSWALTDDLLEFLKPYRCFRMFGDAFADTWERRIRYCADYFKVYVTNKTFAKYHPNCRFMICPGWTPLREPLQKDFQWDIVWVGDGKSDGRRRIAELLRKEYGHRFGLFGRHWDQYVDVHKVWSEDVMGEIYPCSKVILNYMDIPYRHLEGAVSNRVANALRSGRPIVSTLGNGIQELFPTIYFDRTFEKDDTLFETIREVVSKPLDELNECGWKGKAWADRELTYEKAAKRMIEECSE